MRRELRIRVLFESSRLGDDYLQRTYERLVPATARRLQAKTASNGLAGMRSQPTTKEETGRTSENEPNHTGYAIADK